MRDLMSLGAAILRQYSTFWKWLFSLRGEANSVSSKGKREVKTSWDAGEASLAEGAGSRDICSGAPGIISSILLIISSPVGAAAFIPQPVFGILCHPFTIPWEITGMALKEMLYGSTEGTEWWCPGLSCF